MASSATKPAWVADEPTAIFHSRVKLTVVLCLLLTVVTLALYSSVAHHGFANYDDDRYILTNAHVQSGLRWSTIAWAFSSLEEANWHPLTWLSHALDCQVFGLNAAGHHFTSLLFHAANVILLFLLLLRVTGYVARSFMVAALFAVHPLNVETVAWIAERKSLLAMLFFLLSLYAYGWYARRPRASRYALVTLLFAMALMAKPMVITLPFALLLVDYWPLRRMGTSIAARLEMSEPSPQPVWRLCLEKVPLLVLSAGSAIVTIAAQRAGGAISFDASRSPLLRIENAIVCYTLYLGKAFWPSRLALLYPYPHSLQWWKVLSSTLFLVVVTALVVRYREHRYLPVGWFWYLGTMVPMIGLVQVGNQAMADRYAYLPLLGIFVMLVWACADLVAAKSVPEKPEGGYPASELRRLTPNFFAAIGVSIVLALFAVTRLQVSYWRDDLDLWTHTLAVTGPNFVAENAVGAILAQRGRDKEAFPHLHAAAVLAPDDAISQLNLGIYAQQHHDLAQAILRYQAALLFSTDHRIRAAAYANLGQAYFSQRDYALARKNFEAAATLSNPYPIQLGLLAQKAGDWNQAAQYYAYALSIEPTDVGFLLLEQALRNLGRNKDAERAHEQAERRSSDINKAQQTVDDLMRQ